MCTVIVGVLAALQNNMSSNLTKDTNKLSYQFMNPVHQKKYADV